MVINDKYKFIFVHIQNNAGVSITNSLMSIPNTREILSQHSFLSHLDYEKYNDYYKFCIVRNPFDRLVSWYNMMIQKGIHNDFSRYLLQNSNNFSEFLKLTDKVNETNLGELSNYYPKSISYNQLDYISDKNGNLIIDYIGRFENLDSDYKTIANKLVFEIPLSKLNSIEHRYYRTYYKDKDIEIVYNMYKRDIEYFGYEF